MTKKASTSTNKFCNSSDLTNEASVESFFVLRLLKDLGYKDSDISTKKSIKEFKIPKGRAQELYKPDYIISSHKLPRWIIDAKGTGERVENFAYQCAGYSLMINRKYTEKPIRFFMLTNGLLTRVYAWDQEEAVMSLRFTDFVDTNVKYQALTKLLSSKTIKEAATKKERKKSGGHLLERPVMDEIKKAFQRCHRIIWKSEKMSPQASFIAFAKLLFVKLWEDRKLRDNPVLLAAIGNGEPLPINEVRFSSHWIREQEFNSPNPVDAILFRQLVDYLEQEIAARKRKRIFEPSEQLGLSPGTIKRVVEELEDYYLFGIDEDLNGRMFEAFLTATMRGQELGQYFTPRSITKLITYIADLKASPGKIEKVLDGCCGTGGFLIEALTEMRRQLYDNRSLTNLDRNKLLEEVANKAIFGVDAGKDPPISRIARINMYLHGDGGSRIYMTDALRFVPQASLGDTIEVTNDTNELKSLLEKGTLFDAVLTNPPFSMDYSVNFPDEKEVLQDYELLTYDGKRRKSLRSSVMFFERYWNLLQPNGRLLTVIDDSVLSGKAQKFIRSFLHDRFIINGIISLHGDAFQRSGARVKTSILILTKKFSSEENQPSIFVYESKYIGLDDVVPKTPFSVAEKAREQAKNEMQEILKEYSEFKKGKKGKWLVGADKLTDRLDAKFLRPWSILSLSKKWKADGIVSESLSNLVNPIESSVTIDPDKRYSFVRVTYSGRCEIGETRLGKEITYAVMYTAKENDIIVSGIGAVYRAICVLPKEMDGLLISNEYTVLRLRPGTKVDPMYLWAVLRSSAVVAEWLSASSGLARHRVDWNILKSQYVPLLAFDQQKKVGGLYRKALEEESKIEKLRSSAESALHILDLESDEAKDKLERAKPPQ